ncbi:twin-arginine translocase subunit TatC [Candidatus Saccharibacteria bacterium]|nr:twin-arginine translocase subunit TatC [Candidatus Saccharibacteria bacterium]
MTTKTAVSHNVQSSPVVSLTLMDHLRELQRRVVIIVVSFLMVSAAAYPFFGEIVRLIVAPLGNEHQLVYLTPGGAFSFIMQVCLYVGVIGALPVIIYQLYRFVMPAVAQVALKHALLYTGASFAMAVVGIVFSYTVTLPAALYFLTNFDLSNINPMLTIESYFAFVMAYLIAGALLFQLPLIMMMINRVKPLKPQKLFSYQPKVILVSFIVAAILSPTPDALNQILLASPIVVMYQVGIIMVWIANKRHIKDDSQQPIMNTALSYQHLTHSTVEKALPPNIVVENTSVGIRPTPRKTIDGIITTQYARPPKKLPSTGFVRRVVDRQATVNIGSTHGVARSLDGFLIVSRT